MASQKRQRFVLPLHQDRAVPGIPKTWWKPVRWTELSPKLRGSVVDVIRAVDRMAVAKALDELCRTYGVRPHRDHLLITAHRAIRVTILVHQRRPLRWDEVTETTISFLPFVLSELVLGLAAVHVSWDLVPHAPALTLLPILLEARGRAHPALLRASAKAKPRLPSDEEVRTTDHFAYALGWTVGWLQTHLVAVTATNQEIFELGNEALMVFEQAYEAALHRKVHADAMARYVGEGRSLLEQYDKVMRTQVGRESAQPPLDASWLVLETHPVIKAAALCDVTLADETQHRMLRGMLKDALQRLSARQRQAWQLHHLGGIDLQGMAEAMQIDKHTARTHLTRAESAIATGQFRVTLQELADQLEERELFIDMISAALGPQAYRLLSIEEKEDATEQASILTDHEPPTADGGNT